LSSTCLDATAVECNSVVDMINNYGYAYAPPDANCAVGPTHVINATNGVLQWRPKDNPQDTPEFEEPLALFFGLVASPTDYAYTTDPKVIYDQYAQRFVLVLIGGDLFGPAPWLLAVSKTSNPNDGWWRHTFARSAVVSGITYYGDYPGLAVDDDAVYVTANMFSATVSYRGPYLWIIRKTPGGYDGPDGAAIAAPYDLAGLGLGSTTMQPAHMFGAAPAGSGGLPFGTFLVSYGGSQVAGIERIRVVAITDPISTAGGPYFHSDVVSCGNIDNTTAPIAGAPQLGGLDLIDAVDRRVFNAVWRDNSLYLGANCLPPAGPDAGQVTAHWWRVATTFDGVNAPAVALADQGNVGAEDLAPGTHTYIPCVMPDAAGNLAVGFAASGPSLYAGAYFATRKAGDPAGTIGPTCTLAPGVDYYYRVVPPSTRNRWGDYTGLALCPVDESTFWVYNQYAGIGGFPDAPPTIGQGLWHTKLGKFHVEAPVSVAVTSFDAEVSHGAVTLRGAFRSDLGVETVNVYRGDRESALVQIESVSQNGSLFTYIDRDVTPGASYLYRIGVVDRDGEFYSPVVTVTLDAASTTLAQNHPNPFNPTTQIEFSVGKTGPVSLDIYDAAGRLVRHLVRGDQTAGSHSATWDGRDESGHASSSGVYFCRLRAGSVTQTRRLVLLK